MEIRSLNNTALIFERTGVINNPALLGAKEEMRHRASILGIESMTSKNVELRPCIQCPKTGKVSMEKVCQKEKGFIPIDFELAQYLFQDVSFLHHLAQKAKITNEEHIIIVCSGSTIFKAGIATKKPFFLFSPPKDKIQSDVVGTLYVGNLPKTYQLMYRIPNMPYSFPIVN